MKDSQRRDRALRVGQTCLCFAAQRAARALARRFDDLFRAEGVTNGQFSIMVALSSGMNPSPSELADTLGMDRATVTIALKPLVRRGFIEVTPDPQDGRRRHVALCPEGLAVLERLVPLWEAEHAAVEAELLEATEVDAATVRSIVRALGN